MSVIIKGVNANEPLLMRPLRPTLSGGPFPGRRVDAHVLPPRKFSLEEAAAKLLQTFS